MNCAGIFSRHKFRVGRCTLGSCLGDPLAPVTNCLGCNWIRPHMLHRPPVNPILGPVAFPGPGNLMSNALEPNFSGI